MIEYYFQPFPIFDLGDVVLRSIVETDANNYYVYMNHVAMHEYLTKDNMPDSYEKALLDVRYWCSLFAYKRGFYWGIANASDNALIGTIGFNSIFPTHLRGEISYDLDPKFWGRGIMLKALKTVLDFSDHCLKLVRLQATVVTDNTRSIRLLERCGFCAEGILQKYEIVKDQHVDYFMYSRIMYTTNTSRIGF